MSATFSMLNKFEPYRWPNGYRHYGDRIVHDYYYWDYYGVFIWYWNWDKNRVIIYNTGMWEFYIYKVIDKYERIFEHPLIFKHLIYKDIEEFTYRPIWKSISDRINIPQDIKNIVMDYL